MNILKVDDPKVQKNQNLEKCDAEITLLRGTLAEIYYLLKDRKGGGIDNAMLHIESTLPDVKKYKLA